MAKVKNEQEQEQQQEQEQNVSIEYYKGVENLQAVMLASRQELVRETMRLDPSLLGNPKKLRKLSKNQQARMELIKKTIKTQDAIIEEYQKIQGRYSPTNNKIADSDVNHIKSLAIEYAQNLDKLVEEHKEIPGENIFDHVLSKTLSSFIKASEFFLGEENTKGWVFALQKTGDQILTIDAKKARSAMSKFGIFNSNTEAEVESKGSSDNPSTSTSNNGPGSTNT